MRYEGIIPNIEPVISIRTVRITTPPKELTALKVEVPTMRSRMGTRITS